MSKWRERGFVQDSDEEEEELDTISSDSPPPSQKNHHERVASAPAAPLVQLHDSPESSRKCDKEIHLSHEVPTPARELTDNIQPPPSPTTTAPLSPRRAQPESLDPLQRPPTPTDVQIAKPLVQSLSRIEGLPSNGLLLNGFDSDSALSDPPSDDDEQHFHLLSPQRRQAVQVVIPPPTAALREIPLQPSRTFRARKPIQEHPYLIEQEIFKREFIGRGLKPPPRPRSPQHRPNHDSAETQEQEFEPEARSPSNSPPDRTVHTATQREHRDGGRRTGSVDRPAPKHGMADNRTPNFPLTQPVHYSAGRKRLKLNHPSTQAHTSLREDFEKRRIPINLYTRRVESEAADVWAIPHSPPHNSSSPLIGGPSPTVQTLKKSTKLAKKSVLPTPSNSSSVRGDALSAEESDADLEPASTRRPARARPIIAVSSDDESITKSGSSGSDSESDVEVRRIAKRVKGVLPASHVRLERLAQEKREAAARKRMNSAMSPEITEPQRGVAQRSTKRAGPRSVSLMSDNEKDVVMISDQSSEEGGPADTPLRTAPDGVQRSAQEASDLAARFDSRYAEGDLSDMEYDRLDLSTLGGGSTAKRKRQTKITDPYHKSKKPRFSDDGPRGAGSHAVQKRAQSSGFASRKTTRLLKSNGHGKRAAVHSRRSGHIPPRLAIGDINNTPERTEAVPKFLRVAMRQARKRSDQGRQSPKGKHIRLHTIEDTADAHYTLEQWRRGALKPKPSPKPRQADRQPLTDRIANDLIPFSSTSDRDTTAQRSRSSAANTQTRDTGGHAETTRETTSFRRTLSLHRPGTAAKSIKEKRNHPARRPAPSFRPAQLEEPESEVGRSRRNLQFHRGLQLADQQFALGLPLQGPLHNPQLARFLANDDDVAPPLTTPDNVGQSASEAAKRMEQVKRRCLVRKRPAQRLDVEVREYRQPSEPPLRDFILADPVGLEETTAQEHMGLQGLGPSGTMYPVTFDVTPLAMGTYFHSSTFIGAGELRESLVSTAERNMDIPAGHHSLRYGSDTIQCGPWDDGASSGITSLLERLWEHPSDGDLSIVDQSRAQLSSLKSASSVVRSLIRYVSSHLSFLDPIDRQDFATRMKSVLDAQFTHVQQSHAFEIRQSTSENCHRTVRALTYLLVLGTQVYQVAKHSVVEPSTCAGLMDFITLVSRTIVHYIIRKGITELSSFLEKNKTYKEREAGIQEKDTLVETVVVCMHTLYHLDVAGSSFWDVASREISLMVESATDVKHFDSAWATTFTLVPFVELDDSGILAVNRRSSFAHDNWTFVRDLLKRLFSLYSGSKKQTSFNAYVRTTFRRCHVLFETWHWRRCDAILTTVFDFFANTHLKDLQREEGRDSPRFLQNLGDEPQLGLELGDSAFQLFLKFLASGLRAMKNLYPKKKIRSVVFRCTPNHGRSYPKDQVVEQASLDALRNHHDLLCTLYWASPPSCRPKLSLLRGLVQHESSHSKACRINVRAWANLTMFQLSVDEPYSSLQPFAEWHKEIMRQTLKQYRLAKTEADDYLQATRNDGTSAISERMMRLTMDKNQQEVIETLRDCVAGIHRAVKSRKGCTYIRDFLIDSDIVHLLEHSQVDDSRLTRLIRDTLAIFGDYAAIQKPPAAEVSQPRSEESQDYGDFPDWNDLEDIEEPPVITERPQPPLEFIQGPLWHLLSNAFGAERPPEDNLLMECVDTWVKVACSQVSTGDRSWSYYIDSFRSVSWQQLRDTEQTRKYRAYFMATLHATDPSAYGERRLDFLNTLLVSLVDRESMLKFQYRLLQAMVRSGITCPLLDNLPFYRDGETGEFDIKPETLKQRRLALLSSILANMQKEMLRVQVEEPDQFIETKSEYAALLDDMMKAMKNNYQQLRQGSGATGAYVEFVQQVVQFLAEYTADICPVNPFFTSSVTFPLPASDPTYVVGRLSGYAPKLASPGATKTLAIFIQTVAQQAAKDNHGEYLVSQLTTAMTGEDGRAMNKSALRSVLLQGIFPAFVESAFSSVRGLVIAKPILKSLAAVFRTLYYEVRVMDASNVENICNSIWSVAHAFIRGTHVIKESQHLLQQPSILSAFTLLLEAVISMLPILQYMAARSTSSTQKPAFISYICDFTVFVDDFLRGDTLAPPIPTFDLPAVPRSPHSDLLSFCTRDLQTQIKNNWSETPDGAISFGHGYAKKEVLVDIGTYEEEKWRLSRAIDRFHSAVAYSFGNRQDMMTDRKGVLSDLLPPPAFCPLPPPDQEDCVFEFDGWGEMEGG